jgi:AcrR family transcriptional regulator
MRATTEDVRDRVLRAARKEFATYGLAGARIDRVAREAQASKERLYAYFSDKEALFTAVLDLNLTEFFAAVRLTPDDVPGFVGAVVDHSTKYPEHLRMLTWARLDDHKFQPIINRAVPEANIEALREGQRRGLIDSFWDPVQLLELLLAIGLAWAQAPEAGYFHGSDDTVLASCRAASVEAARRLIPPAGTASLPGH